MAYIQAHQSLRDHKKILALSDALNIPEAHSIGLCVSLWMWSLDNAPDAILPESIRAIERAAGWTGENGKFVEAMECAGFFDRSEDKLILHDWNDYAGKLLERRAELNSKTRNMRKAYQDGTIQKVRDRDGDNCRYCGSRVDWNNRKSGNGGTYDHVDPNGPSTLTNLVVACRSCNSAKGNKHLNEVKMDLISPPSNVDSNSNECVFDGESDEHSIRVEKSRVTKTKDKHPSDGASAESSSSDNSVKGRHPDTKEVVCHFRDQLKTLGCVVGRDFHLKHAAAISELLKVYGKDGVFSLIDQALSDPYWGGRVQDGRALTAFANDQKLKSRNTRASPRPTEHRYEPYQHEAPATPEEELARDRALQEHFAQTAAKGG